MSKVSNAQKWQVVAIAAAIASVTTMAKADAQGSHRTFNVKTFGAAGDGTTDDTSAIQAAFTQAANTGSTVVFPSGTYLISNTITGSGVAVVGSGAVITTNTAGVVALLLGGTSPSVTTMGFANGTGATNSVAIEFQNATNVSAVNNTIGANVTDGIGAFNTTGGTITSNNFKNFTGEFGIGLFGSNGITATRNVIIQNSGITIGAAIEDVTGQNNVIQYNAITWNTGNAKLIGIISAGSAATQITHNTVNGSGIGIETASVSSPVTSYNVISNASNAGIVSNTDTTGTINNNTLTTMTNDAIRSTGSTGETVSTNSIDNVGANGIQSTGGNITISNNALGDCGLTTTINAIIRVNNTAATTISVTGNQYKGNTTNVTDYIHVLQATATVTGNKTNSLLPTVVGP